MFENKSPYEYVLQSNDPEAAIDHVSMVVQEALYQIKPNYRQISEKQRQRELCKENHMLEIRNKQIVYTDKDGREYCLDEQGNKIPPMQSRIIKSGDFAPYDSSQGHCAFCGSLTCRGNCIQGGS